MPKYDADNFDPPAPVAYVTLRDPATGATLSDVPMLIDTGADVTLLPRDSVDQLGTERAIDTAYEIQGFDGESKLANVVELELVFLGRKFAGEFHVYQLLSARVEPCGHRAGQHVHVVPVHMDACVPEFQQPLQKLCSLVEVKLIRQAVPPEGEQAIGVAIPCRCFSGAAGRFSKISTSYSHDSHLSNLGVGLSTELP